MDTEGVFNLMMDKKVTYKKQDYGSIRKSCLKKGENFNDTEFPTNNKSIFYSKVDGDIEWKRPGELCRSPKLIEDFSAFDLHEGELGNMWFVTAIGTLISYKKRVEQVIPNITKQGWKGVMEKQDYAGVFQFQFWRFGEIINIVVDDNLPTKKVDDENLPTKSYRLLFCQSRTREIFWCGLLEKAYAKLYGDYESLTNGDAIDTLVDFTGGVAERINLVNIKDENGRQTLFEKLKDDCKNEALIICFIQVKPGDKRGQELPQGFVLGHGYSVTAVKKIMNGQGNSKLLMIRLANPWGKVEWNGPWSETSSEWQKMGPSQEAELQFSKDKGEFWMAFDDFLNHLTNVDICHIVKPSNELIRHSEWTGRSGGCDYKSQSFLSNRQFIIEIQKDEDELVVSLEQHDIKPNKSHTGRTLNTIGYSIMKVEENRLYRLHIPGKLIEPPDMIKTRSVFGKKVLSRGRYVIIPCTKDQKEHGPFLLRLYTHGKASVRELTEEGPSTIWPCLSLPSMVTTLAVLSLENIQKPEGSKDEDFTPKIVVQCEGEKVVSRIPLALNEKNEWETKSDFEHVKVTFYRKKPNEPIIIEVLNRNKIVDDFCCQARVIDNGGEEGTSVKCDVFGRKKEKYIKKSGFIHVFVQSSPDLQFL
ncbi:calpain-5-like [Mytilus californianus]|uniref:calpain-5-like n=1 Tax=Mytilus californianus TaxID=6549 RepID=UPI002245E4AA|nr:calpain-5-like [Mytilus californianus]